MKLKKYEFTGEGLYKLSIKAFAVYLNSSFTFYYDEKTNYYCADNQKADPVFIGNIQNVNNFLETFYEDINDTEMEMED